MRILHWFTLALLATVLMAGSVRAADPEKPPPPLTAEQKAFDMKVRKSLFDVINRGVDLYNATDHAGCYHLFEGALETVAPLLDHHPQLQMAIAAGLKDAANMNSADHQAYHLREVLDKVREGLRNVNAPAPQVKSLYDRLGGEKGVSDVVNDFVAFVASDPKVRFTRDEKWASANEAAVKKLKQHLVEYIGSATGGPQYSGPEIKTVQKVVAITNDDFDAAAVDLKKALVKNGAKAADIEEVLKAMELTRKDIVSTKKPVDSPAPETTLWDRLGGEKGVGKIVDDLIKVVHSDPSLKNIHKPDAPKPTPEQMAALRQDIIAYISSKTGGPLKYEGKSMKAAHEGMNITDEQFDIFVGHFKDVLKKNNAKDDDVNTTVEALKKEKEKIVQPKKPDEKKPADKPATDKKADDKKTEDK
jgi:truncated hemoglobin YjbI